MFEIFEHLLYRLILTSDGSKIRRVLSSSMKKVTKIVMVIPKTMRK